MRDVEENIIETFINNKRKNGEEDFSRTIK